MNIYIAVEAPVALSERVRMFASLDINNAGAFITESEAIAYATKQAQDSRGRTFWVVEGNPLHSFRCEPVPVLREDLVVARVEID